MLGKPTTTLPHSAGFLNFSHARSIYHQSKAVEAEYMLRPPFGEPMRAFLKTAITR